MGLILTEQKGHIAVLTVNRPEALNALNQAVLEDLDQVLDALDFDTVRCVILTGSGEKAFVAGADIGAMLPLKRSEAQAFSAFGNSVMRKLEKLPVPVIAAVNGFALGGGCELAMSCDIRIAAENAVFGQPEVSLGITAGFGGTQRLARLISPAKAKELLYTGSRIKAAEALSLGLVNAVYPAGELMGQAMAMAEKIAANAPIAVRISKQAVDQGLQVGIDEAVAIEAQLFSGCFETEDQKEAMTAFVEKRKPQSFQNK